MAIKVWLASNLQKSNLLQLNEAKTEVFIVASDGVAFSVAGCNGSLKNN